jgi:hypothetical protein
MQTVNKESRNMQQRSIRYIYITYTVYLIDIIKNVSDVIREARNRKL